jgi:RsiW-degrading membrane proteinase PrsW (M82 family)
VTYSPPPPPGEFASSLAQPRRAPGSLIPPAPPAPVGIPTPPVPARRGRTASVWLFGLLVVVLAVLVGYFLSALGPAASLIGMAVAIVPFLIVLGAVRVIDRWEPEPRSLVVFAIAWGAIAAIGFALLVDLVISGAIASGGSDAREVLRAVVQAPIVEEVGKGLGLLLLFVSARRSFDGPVDGVVYGALIGAGFAFTENIQYFAIAFIEGGAVDLSTTFFVRGILSPFAHAMFTSVTGLALGLAARRGARFGQALGAWLMGLTGAILLHALWNGSAVFGDFFQLYLTLQIPLFVIFILGVLALRREEARLTRNRLGDYAVAGWFTPQEVDMLATPGGRRMGLAWAKTLNGDRTALMRGFITDATALAAARQRGISGRDPHAADDERVLLERTAAARAALLSL